MLKWLVIIVGTIISFLLVVAIIGYQLKSNEEKNRAYLEQKHNKQADLIERQVKKLSVAPEQILSFEQTNSYQIIKQHLTCINNQQCKAVKVSFADQSCLLAINSIGAARLLKAAPTEQVGSCPSISVNTEAVCLDNVCQLKKMRN
ncbi:hypothetical protein [Thalassotalea sp. PP2-459]|uniref:hypothetical protein n=1 Tax=Thalassotalea sp. PP2-459 TaxID=1742724 RepID=UPI000942BBF6|nr:hypothetical protein [Thalassotalea sp. PP2-459]OKY25285.1 hypothetical protein BI291_16810 [Thalassotalea sp. PP2-459]